ncbi:MAG: hypothetical protein Q6L49_01155 [Thermostichales cyanobacterium HHBFW_bins_127]
MATAEGSGKSSQSESAVVTRFGGSGATTDVREELLAQATQATAQAIDEVLSHISSNPKLLAVTPAVPKETALVADLSLMSMVLNRGSEAGYRVGLKLSIEKIIREVKDPATGEVLRTVTEPVGKVQITEVDTKSSVAKILSGSRFAIGDLARPVGY